MRERYEADLRILGHLPLADVIAAQRQPRRRRFPFLLLRPIRVLGGEAARARRPGAGG